MAKSKSDAYALITDQVLELLEKDLVPWRKPWKPADFPRSVRGHRYRGINVFLLAMKAQANGYSDPRWLTFKQARALAEKVGITETYDVTDPDTGEVTQKERIVGGVKKGEKSTVICFWKWIKRKDKETGEETRIPFLRYFKVFNVEQCENLGLKSYVSEADNGEHTPIEVCEAIVGGYKNGPTIKHGGDMACYRPKADSVSMPKPESFESPETYYSTMFHELGHSTGHESRLAREGVTDAQAFGSHEYSKEELCAEMTAAFLCGEAGIVTSTIENSAAYIKNWMKALKNDTKMVVSAGAQAQKAADLILGVEFKKNDED